MHIPDRLRNKILRAFGQQGEEWLQRAPHIYAQAVSKWNLTNLELSGVLSYNLVCFAESPDFGEVALKVGVPHRELFTEMRALALYDGRHICKCYDYDEDLGALLLQRIQPGVDLTTVVDHNERVRIAAELVSSLPICPQSRDGLPHYRELVVRAFSRARQEGRVGPTMLELICKAEEVYAELQALSLPDMLLHGDLNHWNILRDRDNQWMAIDPKGMLGARAQDTARFMLNELEMIPADLKETAMDRMIIVFANNLGESPQTVAMSLLMDRIVSSCWSFEEDIDKERMNTHVKDCEFVWNYVKTILHK